MITLASDFGSPYPAAMKGVILRRTDARLVDVAHDFPRQDVRAAAFWLREVLPWFPPATHLAVVDPGVGTDRDALAVRAGEHAVVAPDNGVAMPVARRLADGGDIEAFAVAAYDAESNTFHGRDVFAPAAATVHETTLDHVGDLDGYERVEEPVDLRFPEPDVDGDLAVGEVLAVDGFGNAVTNIPGEFVREAATAAVNGETVPVARSYAVVEAGERLVTVGSHGNVELAVNQGRGEEAFRVGVGATVRVER